MLFVHVAAWPGRCGPGSWRPLLEREGSLLAFVWSRREKGSEAVSPVAMVWPCPLPVDAYAEAGRQAGFPRPACPSCAGPLVFWSGYRRHVRAAGRCRKVFVPRLRCGSCRVSHALLPAFVLAWRLDVAETVGMVIAEVAAHDRARVGAPVRRPRTADRGRVRCAGGGSGRACALPAGAAWPVRARGDRRGVRRRIGPAGVGRAGGVAVRLRGERREADRRQHNLALPGGRQTAFHASCPAITGMREAEGWITSCKSRSRCTAGR